MNMEKRAGWGANDQREKRVIGRGRSRRLTRERERVATPGFAGRPLYCWSIFGPRDRRSAKRLDYILRANPPRQGGAERGQKALTAMPGVEFHFVNRNLG